MSKAHFPLTPPPGTWFSAAATSFIRTKSRRTPLSCRAPSRFRGVSSLSTVAELGRGSGSHGGREACRGAPWQVSLRPPTGRSRMSPESPALGVKRRGDGPCPPPAPHSEPNAARHGRRQDEKGGHLSTLRGPGPQHLRSRVPPAAGAETPWGASNESILTP